MENKIGKDFNSLAQRIIYSYTGTFPKFVAAKSDKATEHSQKQMYDFMWNIAQKLYNAPEVLELPVQQDDSYLDWELQNRKPQLIEAMRKHIKKIDDFYLLLLRLGELGKVKDDKLYVSKNDMKLMGKTLARLERFGLMSESGKGEVVFWSNEHTDLFPAWKLLVDVSVSQKNSLLYFSRCMFDTEYSYASDIFEALMENKSAFQMLCNFFVQNGYKLVDCRENEVSLDWVKKYGKKDEPLKASWAEREHGGISIYYDYKKKNQIVFGLRVPKFKELMLHFDEMDDQLKEFVIAKTKKCDGCGYCTQTDKTGTRKPQFASVVHNGEFNLCLLFPGFSYVWTYVNNDTASDIILFLTYADRLFHIKEQV